MSRAEIRIIERDGYWQLSGCIPFVEVWDRVSCDQRLSLPKVSACYALFKKGRLVYIGESTNLKRRIQQHSKQALDFDEVRYLCLPGAQRVVAERVLICAYWPPINKEKLERASRAKKYSSPPLPVERKIVRMR